MRIQTDLMLELRKALLMVDRKQSHLKGQRKLMRLMKSPQFAAIRSLAHVGLAMSYFNQGDYTRCISECVRIVGLYGPCLEAVFCLNMLERLYTQFGMGSERFEAEQTKIHVLKKMANTSRHLIPKRVILSELQQAIAMQDSLLN